MEFGNQSKSYLSELNRITKYNLLSCGYQKLNVSTAGAKSLTIPTDARYAEMTIESSVTTGVVTRYLLLGNKTLPTSTDGMGLINLTTFDITGYANLLNFRIILATAGTHTLHIQYYK